eukprot:2865440-Rhodomonas_salina.1
MALDNLPCNSSAEQPPTASSTSWPLRIPRPTLATRPHAHLSTGAPPRLRHSSAVRVSESWRCGGLHDGCCSAGEAKRHGVESLEAKRHGVESLEAKRHGERRPATVLCGGESVAHGQVR